MPNQSQVVADLEDRLEEQEDLVKRLKVYSEDLKRQNQQLRLTLDQQRRAESSESEPEISFNLTNNLLTELELADASFVESRHEELEDLLEKKEKPKERQSCCITF